MNSAVGFDWNDLRYFLAAARALSFAGAARLLNVKHSTVIRRLDALEQVLGGRLMLRSPGGLTLTPLGEQVFAAALKFELAAAAVKDVVAGAQERVRVAVPSGFSMVFTAILEQLRASQPPVSLELLSGARLVDLERGEADLAIRGGPVADLDLVATPLCHVGWCLYASPEYLRRRPANPEPSDIAGHDIIGFDHRLSETPNGRWVESRISTARLVMRGAEIIEIAAAATQGVGIALLPCYLGDRSADLTRVSPDVLVSRELVLVYRREAKLSATVRRVIAVTLEVFKRFRGQLEGVSSAAG